MTLTRCFLTIICDIFSITTVNNHGNANVRCYCFVVSEYAKFKLLTLSDDQLSWDCLLPLTLLTSFLMLARIPKLCRRNVLILLDSVQKLSYLDDTEDCSWKTFDRRKIHMITDNFSNWYTWTYTACWSESADVSLSSKFTANFCFLKIPAVSTLTCRVIKSEKCKSRGIQHNIMPQHSLP